MVRSSSRYLTFALALLAGLWLAGPATAEDWPQFRGYHRDGISTETGLLAEWREGGPREIFRRPIGEGYSAVTVVGDRLYSMYHFSSSLLHDGHIYGFDNSTFKCISAETGDTRWAKRGLGKGSLTRAGSPSPTPRPAPPGRATA